MTIDEAIEENRRNKTPYPIVAPVANADMARRSEAEQLGIEALELTVDLRKNLVGMPRSYVIQFISKLPSETEGEK